MRVIKKKESSKKFAIFDFLQSFQYKTPIILLLTYFIHISMSLSTTKKYIYANVCSETPFSKNSYHVETSQLICRSI